jgi:hypothetical protein
MEEVRNVYKIFLIKPEGHMGGLGIDGRQYLNVS